MKNNFCTGIAAILIAACVVSAPASAGAIKNTAVTYITESQGGNGIVFYPIPHGKAGAYQLSYTALFAPQGSPSAPVAFFCSLLLTHLGEQNTISGSSTTSVSSSGVSPGVNGLVTLTIAADDEINASCGRIGGTWQWSAVPLHVTLLRIDGSTQVKIH